LPSKTTFSGSGPNEVQLTRRGSSFRFFSLLARKKKNQKERAPMPLARLRRVPCASSQLPGVCKLAPCGGSDSANSFFGSFCGARLRANGLFQAALLPSFALRVEFSLL
jgi:hypothetical protein